MKSADPLHLMMFYLGFVSISVLLGLGMFIAVRVVNLESYPTTATTELAQCQALLLQCQVNALALVPVRGISAGPAPPADPEPPLFSSVKDPL